MKTFLTYFLALFFACGQTFSQDKSILETPERYLLAKIWFQPTFQITDAENEGVDIEHCHLKPDLWIESAISESTFNRLKSKGVKLEIQIENLAEYYENRNVGISEIEQTTDVPKNFHYGLMGGFYSLDEANAEMQLMRQKFPNFVSDSIRIGTTYEKRPIYAYLIADHNISSDKPEVLFTTLHHAREPGGLSALIYFLWDLLEKNGNGDAEAKYLLENRQTWVIPVVNPDGYAYNFKINPNGGGMWRKNRKPVAGGNFGVDLNRNYGPIEFWNSANNGSSTSANIDTYRGESPFSELETQAVSEFCKKHAFKTTINYHTYGDLLIYPLGYVDSESQDSLYFRAFTANITKNNKYSAGLDLQTVGYSVRGSSDDWMYAYNIDHAKIFAITPEIGTTLDGFYSPKNRIIPLSIENLKTNYQNMWSARTNIRPVQSYVRKNILTNGTSLVVEFQNIGIETSATISPVILTSLDAKLTINQSTRQIQKLKSVEKQVEIFDLVPNGSVENGSSFPIEILITEENVPRRDTIQVQIYQPEIISLTATTATIWNFDKWGIVFDKALGENVLTDSPAGNYSKDSTQNYLTTKNPINLDGILHATLEFDTRWTIESHADFAVIQASTDNGATWKYLQSATMKAGVGGQGSRQVVGSFGFDGSFQQWLRQECSLDAFVGNNVLLRFGLLSDVGTSFDGWYLGNIAVRLYPPDQTDVFESKNSGFDLKLTPNPAESEVKLSYNIQNEAKITAEIFDIVGNRIFVVQENHSAGEHYFNFDVSGLSAGIYFCLFQSGTSKITKSFVVMMK